MFEISFVIENLKERELLFQSGLVISFQSSINSSQRETAYAYNSSDQSEIAVQYIFSEIGFAVELSRLTVRKVLKTDDIFKDWLFQEALVDFDKEMFPPKTLVVIK